jgi:hypothetical protein
MGHVQLYMWQLAESRQPLQNGAMTCKSKGKSIMFAEKNKKMFRDR